MIQPSSEEKAALLAALPLFASLSGAECMALALRSHWHHWPKGQAIFHEGEKAHGMHIVLQGMVKIFHNSADGRERVLHLIRPGNTFGEGAVFQRSTYPAHAATLSATTALYVPAEVLLTLIAENPDLALRMLAALSLRLRMFTRKLEAHSKSDASSRLAAYLLHRLRLNPHKPSEVTGGAAAPLLHIRLEVSREILANMLGIARETVSRTFSRLQQAQILSLKGRDIYILDVKALQQLAENSE